MFGISFSWFKAKLAGLGALLLAMLYFFVRLNYVKRKNKELKEKANTLEARHHIKVVNEHIKKEEKEKRKKELEKIKEEVNKQGEEFEGLDNLSNPDNY